eukprot:GHVQ01003803.1.p1 GENE.GHVQ01003803.1~~GHVQ01003803.1.p1  ORF type:complete len:512 (+),score=86.85 GHVQ01003803.1:89-1624(+)
MSVMFCLYNYYSLAQLLLLCLCCVYVCIYQRHVSCVAHRLSPIDIHSHTSIHHHQIAPSPHHAHPLLLPLQLRLVYPPSHRLDHTITSLSEAGVYVTERCLSKCHGPHRPTHDERRSIPTHDERRSIPTHDERRSIHVWFNQCMVAVDMPICHRNRLRGGNRTCCILGMNRNRNMNINMNMNMNRNMNRSRSRSSKVMFVSLLGHLLRSSTVSSYTYDAMSLTPPRSSVVKPSNMFNRNRDREEYDKNVCGISYDKHNTLCSTTSLSSSSSSSPSHSSHLPRLLIVGASRNLGLSILSQSVAPLYNTASSTADYPHLSFSAIHCTIQPSSPLPILPTFASSYHHTPDSSQTDNNTTTTLCSSSSNTPSYTVHRLDARDSVKVDRLIQDIAPDVVVSCLGSNWNRASMFNLMDDDCNNNNNNNNNNNYVTTTKHTVAAAYSNTSTSTWRDYTVVYSGEEEKGFLVDFIGNRNVIASLVKLTNRSSSSQSSSSSPSSSSSSSSSSSCLLLLLL